MAIDEKEIYERLTRLETKQNEIITNHLIHIEGKLDKMDEQLDAVCNQMAGQSPTMNTIKEIGKIIITAVICAILALVLK